MSLNPLLLPRNARQIFIKSPDGVLDTLELSPKTNQIIGVAVVFHPDPKGGGTYTNKIVQTVAKVLNNKGYLCFCPNLRGVGESSGQHDFGKGEVADGLAIIDYIKQSHPNLPIFLAGFSFGTAVASNVAKLINYQQLLLIGPAVTRYNVVVPNNDKTIVIHGQDDEVIGLDDVFTWANNYNIPVTVFSKTGHFFHGKLVALQNYLEQIIGN